MEVWLSFQNTEIQPLIRFERLLKIGEISAYSLFKVDVFFSNEIGEPLVHFTLHGSVQRTN